MAVPTSRRFALSVLIGLLAACLAGFRAATASQPRDFTVLWEAARALLVGQDPYAAQPGLLYPLPSVVAALPWALVGSTTLANALFMFVSAAAFGWARMEHGTAPLFGGGLVEPPLRRASGAVDATPAGSVAIAPLTLLLVTKPQTGLVIFCARPTWWAIVGGLACIGVAFALDPAWVGAWRASIAVGGGHLGTAPTGFPYTAPVLLPVGRSCSWQSSAGGGRRRDC